MSTIYLWWQNRYVQNLGQLYVWRTNNKIQSAYQINFDDIPRQVWYDVGDSLY